MLTLYHASHSPCAQKVRLVLAEKDIAFESVMFDLATKEHLNPDYLKINPKGVVPALVDDGAIITESTVICEYLDDRFAQSSLRPANAVARARMRLWLKLVDEVLHPATAPVVFTALMRPMFLAKSEDEREALFAKVPDPVRRERQRRLVALGFDAPDVTPALADWAYALQRAEKDLASAPWLAGESYSLADAALTPYVEIMRNLDVRRVFDELPRLADWFARAQARPSHYVAMARYTSESHAAYAARIAKDVGPKIGAALPLAA